MTAYDKFSGSKSQNFPQPIQIQLSKKLNVEMSLHFLNLRKSLNTLKKNERHNLGICEIIVSERRRYLNVYKVLY